MFEELSKVLGEKVYSVGEAAPVLAMCAQKVLELIHERKLKASKIGRRYVVTESAIRSYVNTQKQ